MRSNNLEGVAEGKSAPQAHPTNFGCPFDKNENNFSSCLSPTAFRKSRNEFGICFDDPEQIRKHKGPDSHPEHPDRLLRILNSLARHNILSLCTRVAMREATESELSLAHNSDLTGLLESKELSLTNPNLTSKRDVYEDIFLSAVSESGGTGLEVGDSPNDLTYLYVTNGDTYLSEGSCRVAKRAVGGTLSLADSIMDPSNAIQSGFSLIRPPGHHATRDGCMGFCLFNSVAICAKYLQQKYSLQRILILDWDVHHGNGTQDIVDSSSRICYVSVHRYFRGRTLAQNYFPGTGNINEIGSQSGKGFTVNIPLEKGYGDTDMHAVFSHVILPVIHSYHPEFILVSAGFDACIGDPLGQCNVTPECFSWMSGLITYAADIYSNGRALFILEGGYHVSMLEKCVCKSFEGIFRAQNQLSRFPNPLRNSCEVLLPGAPFKLLSWGVSNLRLFSHGLADNLPPVRSAGMSSFQPVRKGSRSFRSRTQNKKKEKGKSPSFDVNINSRDSFSVASGTKDYSQLPFELTDTGPELEFLQCCNSASLPPSRKMTLNATSIEESQSSVAVLDPSIIHAGSESPSDGEQHQQGSIVNLMVVPMLSTWLVIRNVAHLHSGHPFHLEVPQVDILSAQPPRDSLSKQPQLNVYHDGRLGIGMGNNNNELKFDENFNFGVKGRSPENNKFSLDQSEVPTAPTLSSDPFVNDIVSFVTHTPPTPLNCPKDVFIRLGGHGHPWLRPLVCSGSAGVVKPASAAEAAFYGLIRFIVEEKLSSDRMKLLSNDTSSSEVEEIESISAADEWFSCHIYEDSQNIEDRKSLLQLIRFKMKINEWVELQNKKVIIQPKQIQKNRKKNHKSKPNKIESPVCSKIINENQNQKSWLPNIDDIPIAMQRVMDFKNLNNINKNINIDSDCHFEDAEEESFDADEGFSGSNFYPPENDKFEISHLTECSKTLDVIFKSLVKFIPFLPRLHFLDSPFQSVVSKFVKDVHGHHMKVFEYVQNQCGPNGQDLNSFIDAYDGSRTPCEMRAPNLFCHIEMQNVLNFPSAALIDDEKENEINFKNIICVMDLKIGSRLFGDDSDFLKMRRMIKKSQSTTAGETGMTLIGYRTAKWTSPLSDPEIVPFHRSDTRKITDCIGLFHHIELFLTCCNSLPPIGSFILLVLLAVRCTKLLNHFQNQYLFHLHSSSLLVAFDASVFFSLDLSDKSDNLKNWIRENHFDDANKCVIDVDLLLSPLEVPKTEHLKIVREVLINCDNNLQTKCIDFAHASWFHNSIDTSYIHGIEGFLQFLMQQIKSCTDSFV